MNMGTFNFAPMSLRRLAAAVITTRNTMTPRPHDELLILLRPCSLVFRVCQ
uniref:Uncharacterized protein n=1 Tax=Physcomitrium patens TaxID=3218 RepID=A0A2K1L7G2_PHYPA|nr:hypothetical protein PHYPA_000387 [Physcomitrium patens]